MSLQSRGKRGRCASRLLAAAFVVASCASQATPFTAYIDQFYIEKNLGVSPPLPQTNNDSNDTVNGLKQNSTFDVLGLFDYVTPGINDSYGVRLTDGGQNDVVEIRVAWSSILNAPVVRFLRQDFVLGTLTVLQEVALPTAFSGPIVLGLLHQTAGTDVISAGFCLGDFSFCDSGGAVTLSATTTIFQGESWTRG